MPSPVSDVSPRVLRVMMAAAVGLLIAGSFAAVAHDGGDDTLTTLDREATREPDGFAADDPVADASAAPTTAVTADEATSGDSASTTAPVATSDGGEDPAATDTAPSSDEEPAPTTTRATTATPPPTTAAASAPSRQLRPVPAGTYEYATDGSSSINGDEKPMPETTTLQAPAAGSDGRQTTTRDMRDANGDGSVTETSLRFTGEGVFLERIKSTVFLNNGTFSQSTTLTPTATYLLIPTGAKPGTKTAGQLQGDGITADVTFEVLTVGDETSASRLVADLSGEVQGRQTSEITSRSTDLLTVKEVSESDIRSGPVHLQSSYTAILR